jgi:glutathione S-transferase
VLTLYTFGPTPTLPDPSPFVVKALVLLKLSGLAFETKTGGLGRAPKGKLPYLDDDGVTVADSTFIRLHLETRHGIDFDRGLTPAQKGEAWAFEKLCEDHLYWILVRERWTKQDNFNAGPRMFFQGVPAPVRPLIMAIVRRKVRRELWAQGLGRHSEAEIVALARRGFGAISDFLDEKAFLMGAEPCGADAVVFGWIVNALWENTKGEVSNVVAGFANLCAYRDRCMRRWFKP